MVWRYWKEADYPVGSDSEYPTHGKIAGDGELRREREGDEVQADVVLTLNSWWCSAGAEMDGNDRNRSRKLRPWSKKNGRRRRLRALRLDSFGGEVAGDAAELPVSFDLLGDSSIDGDELGGHGG